MAFPNSTETWPKIAKALGLNEDARVRRAIIDVRWDAPAVVYVELFACEEVFEDATLEALLSGAEIVTNEQPTIEEATESQTAELREADRNRRVLLRCPLRPERRAALRIKRRSYAMPCGLREAARRRRKPIE